MLMHVHGIIEKHAKGDIKDRSSKEKLRKD